MPLPLSAASILRPPPPPLSLASYPSLPLSSKPSHPGSQSSPILSFRRAGYAASPLTEVSLAHVGRRARPPLTS
eukprot:6072649-Pyramimonas_sp.AAC.1